MNYHSEYMLYEKAANQVSASEFSAARYLDHAREDDQTAHDFTKLELEKAIEKMRPENEKDRQTYLRIMSHNRNLDDEFGRIGGDGDEDSNPGAGGQDSQ